MNTIVTKKLMLFFPKCECEKPIIYHLVKDYDLIVNIFRAKVTPEEEGYLVLDVTGTDAHIERAMDYLRTALLFTAEKEIQPEALYKAAGALDKLNDKPSAKMLRQKLRTLHPNSPYAKRTDSIN